MNEKQMTLGRDWSGESLSGWLMSEKFDGCRAYWDGQQLWTRSGRAIKAPAWFTQGLPAVHLDCELWAGYGRFQAASEAARYGRFTSECVLLVHDCPQAAGNWLQRLASASTARCCRPVAGSVCRNHEHLDAELSAVVARGGEGLVLRHPDAGYVYGRTSVLLKVKPGNWYYERVTARQDYRLVAT